MSDLVSGVDDAVREVTEEEKALYDDLDFDKVPQIYMEWLVAW